MSEEICNGVFRFFDGEKPRYGDPLKIHRELYMALGSPDEVFAAYESDDPAAWMPAAGRIAEAARLAFPMAPFDPATGKGATEQHCRDAVDALWACLAGEKKAGTTAGSPTGSPATTSTPTSSPSPSASG